MHITIQCPTPRFAHAVRDHFADNNVECMICNNETEVSLFNLDPEQADYLLNAFLKQFHLKNATATAADAA